MVGKFKIVDGHAHTFSSDAVAEKLIPAFNKAYDLEFNNPGTGTIRNLLDNMKRGGIDFTVMANFAPPKILHDNNLWSISVSQTNKELVPLVSFHPDMEEDLGTLFEQYLNMGAKGIKIHPMAQGFEPDHRALQEVYRLCNELSFPVVFHCGRVSNARLNEYADLCMIMPVIDKYPDIPVILTHMADGNIEDVVYLAGNYKNVFFDTSIVITGYPPILNANEPSWVEDSTVLDVVNRIGAERMLFGSDYPWGSPIHDTERFFGMNITDKQKSLILGENSIKIFKIEVI